MAEDKKTYPNASQKARLLSLMEADDELRQGKFSAVFTKKMAESRWQNIARELNSIPGSRKDWKAWRKAWQDMKSKTKKKQSQIHRSHNLTGGGPAIPPLTDNETGILATISQSSVIGHQDSSESQVIFIEEIAGPSQCAHPASSADPEVIVDIDDDDFILDIEHPLKEKGIIHSFNDDLYVKNLIRETRVTHLQHHHHHFTPAPARTTLRRKRSMKLCFFICCPIFFVILHAELLLWIPRYS